MLNLQSVHNFGFLKNDYMPNIRELTVEEIWTLSFYSPVT